MQSLMLLPGFLCDEAVWKDQMEALSDIAECTCIDWGLLDSIVGMAEAVLRAAPARFSMAGHSMGGRVAFQVYRLAPQRVERIALMNTGADCRPPGPAGDEEIRKRQALLDVARADGMRAAGMKWYPPMINPARMSDEPLAEAILRMVERKTPEIWEAQMNALIHRPDATPVLAQIRCPSLLLSGRQDGWSPPSAHEKMSASIPGSKLVIVENSGHMSTMEQPAEVSRAMRDWMKTPL
jgi:pimeloyl-ACP methyl ester carboxylesterase